MEYFFDTSAFIKAVRLEPGSDWVRRAVRDPLHQIFVSRLVVPEAFSVLGRVWRAGQLTSAARDATALVLMQILRHRRLHVKAITNAIADAAGQLALTLVAAPSSQGVLRALDALQLATALDIRQGHPRLVFVYSDARLLALAQTAGQVAIDPTTQP